MTFQVNTYSTKTYIIKRIKSVIKLVMIGVCQLIVTLALDFNHLSAKVIAPNFNFDLKELDQFAPGTNITNLDKNKLSLEIYSQSKDFVLYRGKILSPSYKYTVIIQTYQEKITDFFIRLPPYFLHDTFHQELIKRYSKQQVFQKVEQTSSYGWKLQNSTLIYSATCTFTCFPLFITQITNTIDPQIKKKFKSLMQQFDQ